MELIFLAVALSMDAFAAALGLGAGARPDQIGSRALRVGLAFGAAQAFMPLLGWGLGIAFASMIQEIDHWVAFVLLGTIGGRMAWAGLTSDSNERAADEAASPLRGGALSLLAVATSIDAAVAGITLPVLDQPVLVACAIIGAFTLMISAMGVLLGRTVGAMAGRRAEVLGGIVLVAIGAKILIAHLFFGG